MKLEYINNKYGYYGYFVDGENIEFMTPQKREQVLQNILASIDHRMLEGIIVCLVNARGTMDITSEETNFSCTI